jgi:membrane-bound metal-dependent hydrolase YbcI (DUF457 family)
MFLGHFGLAFAAKKASPSISLGALFLACQFADLLWPTLVLAGIERVEIEPGATTFTPLDFVSYPYSHSLVALILWAVIVGTIYMMATRAPAAAAVTLGLLVLSHWVLDYVTHRPDMPLTMGGPQRLGLGLWNSVRGTLATEFAIFGAGIMLYRRSTAARDRIGSIGLWSMVAFLLVVYLISSFGPPPPSPTAVAWSVQAMWLVVVWAYWVDRHRTPVARRI